MNFLRSLIIGISFVLIAKISLCQTNEKPVIIDGKKFIIHTVEKGHTLYAISKRYMVTLEDIVKENPSSSTGVKVGDRLRIPYDRIDKAVARNPAPTIEKDYLLHTVSKKETLYSISKRYEVDPSDIIESNPEAAVSLREGASLKIPVARVKFVPSVNLIPADDGTTITHKVGKMETMYSLSKLYNVTVEEIKAANGGLGQGLREGMDLRIPKNPEARNPGQSKSPSSENPFQTTTTLGSSPISRSSDGKNPVMFGNYKVAMMLPFEMGRMDSIDRLGHELVALEFYQGAMIAIDSLRQLGLDMDVYVFDTNKDAGRVKQLTARPELSDVDLFIGPLYKSELMALSEYASVHQSHVVCPVPQSGGILLNRPFLSKAHCDDATQLASLARFLIRRYSQDNIVMIAPMKPSKEKFSTLFSSAFMATRNGSVLLKELLTDQLTTAAIEAKLVTGKMNVIYAATNELAYVTSLINKLLDLQKRYSIILVGNEDWAKIDQIDNSYKNRLNLHLPMANFVDYESPLVKDFLSKYRERYGTDPNKYGFLGFDVTMYYLYGMSKQGREFFRTIDQPGMKLTSTKFKMEKPSETVGFNNFGTFIVRYNDFKLEVVE